MTDEDFNALCDELGDRGGLLIVRSEREKSVYKVGYGGLDSSDDTLGVRLGKLRKEMGKKGATQCLSPWNPIWVLPLNETGRKKNMEKVKRDFKHQLEKCYRFRTAEDERDLFAAEDPEQVRARCDAIARRMRLGLERKRGIAGLFGATRVGSLPR